MLKRTNQLICLRFLITFPLYEIKINLSNPNINHLVQISTLKWTQMYSNYLYQLSNTCQTNF